MTNALSFRPDAVTPGRTGPSFKPLLQLNQVVQARVVGQAVEQVFSLRIGNTEVSARSDLPLTTGTRLTLQVTSLQPEAILKVIARDNRTPQTDNTDPAAAATRQLLPRQSSLPSLFALLRAVSSRGGETGLPQPLKNGLQAILERVPTSELSADGVKRAISDSGLFLEAKLLRPSTSSGHVPELDFKRLLLALLQRLPAAAGSGAQRPQVPAPEANSQHPHRQSNPPGPNADTAPPAGRGAADSAGARSSTPADSSPGRLASPQPQPREPLPDLSAFETDSLTNKLRQQVEGALARLTLHQVHSVKNSGEGDLSWTMELPFLHKGQIDVIPLAVERRTQSGNSEGEANWMIKLALDTPQFGSLYATILWRRGQVSSVFWAERDATAALIRSHLGHLRDALAGQGLTVASLECRKGKPPDTTCHKVPQHWVYGKA